MRCSGGLVCGWFGALGGPLPGPMYSLMVHLRPCLMTRTTSTERFERSRSLQKCLGRRVQAVQRVGGGMALLGQGWVGGGVGEGGGEMKGNVVANGRYFLA